MNRIVLVANIMLEAYWSTCIAESLSQSELKMDTYFIPYEEFEGENTELSKADIHIMIGVSLMLSAFSSESCTAIDSNWYYLCRKIEDKPLSSCSN